MKATFTLALFMFIGMFAFGQTDTVYYTSGCDRSFYNEVYNFHLGNNTFFAEGRTYENCCGQNYLVYTITENVIKIKKVQECDYANCLCYYPFDFSIEGCTLLCYRVIVEGTDVDTTVCQTSNVGIANKVRKPSVLVYPNPATTKVTVMLTEKEKGNATFEIYNIIGQKVYSREKVTDTFEFERSNISKGAYFYKLIWKNGSVLTGKIIFE